MSGGYVTTLKITSLNAEWMNDWFTPDADPVDFRTTFTRDGEQNRTDITAGRLADLIRSVDPDILAMQEAPSRPAELALFLDRYLNDAGTRRYEFIMGDTGGAQKLALLYKPAVIHVGLTPSSQLQMLIEPWLADVDGDAVLDSYEFTRLPLVTTAQVGQSSVQVIVAHTKSNFVNQGQTMWENPATRQAYIVAALKNRRRIATEGMRLRQYLDDQLQNDAAARIIVLGDLNDGAGRDYFEENYLAHNVTDVLVGSTFKPEWLFTHAQHDLPESERYSAVFDDFVTDEPNRHLLLDHILLAPGFMADSGIRVVAGTGTAEHVAYEALVVNQGRKREDRPSDHRPVSVTLQY
jgi:endonuclease/exonuclease/phosphatase family metal-dependent hydrolase